MSEARYPYLHIDIPPDEVELLSNELFELGALGIEERDASTLLRGEAGDARVTLVVSFESDEAAQAVKDELGQRYNTRIEHVVGDAWREGWREYFKPMRVGKRLVVKPSWEPFEARAEDVVLTLDPGQAFGTGTHESTQLLLAEVETRVTKDVAVLDVGTGSGILGIAALLLGAASVEAIDVDPLAVSAADENAMRNGVASLLRASTTPLTEVRGRYLLVLANIEARVLVPVAETLAARVAPGGLLLLSGLLHEHADPVRAAYPQFRELARPRQGEWSALVLQAADADATHG